MYASYWIWSRKRELKANKKRGLRVHAYSSLISQERIESYMNLRPRINSSNWSRKRELKANSYIPRVIFVYLLWSRKRELKERLRIVFLILATYLISQERIERGPSSAPNVATQPFWSRKRELKDTALGVLAYTGAVRWSRKRELKVHPCSGMGNRRWQPDLARENWKQKPA